jgi:tetraacyldisaccharide 4'-kinase
MPLLDPRRFREIVSGQRRTLGATFFRAVAGLAETPMRWAVAWRNRRYDRGAARIERVPAPVISIGNLTLGGTGKTPLVAWIAQEIERAGRGVTLISRGYGGQGSEQNDEARELALRLPHVPHWQNPDRVAAARQALAAHPEHVLVLDDAFQHRRIARDLDLVLLDASEPFGYERLFPRGTLREPPTALARSQAVILTRADLLAAEGRAEVRARVARLAPQAAWGEVCFSPRQFRNTAGEVQPLAALQGRPVLAFCGIGNPAGFEHTLQTAGLRVLGMQVFRDHQPYGGAELAQLAKWAQNHASAAAIVCTLKDLVKLEPTAIAGLPLWALEVQVEFLTGEAELRNRLSETLATRFDSPPSAT